MYKFIDEIQAEASMVLVEGLGKIVLMTILINDL
jgi:hypothetical protein